MKNIIKQILRNIIIKWKGINIDLDSTLNLSVIIPSNFKSAKIRNSKLELVKIGEGCFLENVISYGDIELEDYVSISGPGTVLHAVDGKIKIGRFTSIAQNVSIQQFNHNMKLPSTYAMQFHFFSHEFLDDVVSKGDVVIEEDVWIGSNVVILSGVRIGRGAVIAAGAVVTRNVEPYSVVGGIPAKKIKMRFSDNSIKKLEISKWWTWNIEQIRENKAFFFFFVE